jgi:multimeric flavodoxin WrbA
MKIVITDTGTWPYRLNKEDRVIQDTGFLQPCRQCASCWVKTPGMCVIPDQLQYLGADLSRCEEVVLVSRVEYGALSPFVSSVLERMKPYVYPSITGNGAGKFRCRYNHRFTLSAFLYNEDIEEEEKTAVRNLLYQTADQLSASIGEIVFMHDALSMGVRV